MTLKSPTLVKVFLFWSIYVGGIFLTGQLQMMVPSPFGPLVWGAASVPFVFVLNRVFSRADGRTLKDIWITVQRRDRVTFGIGLAIGLSFLPITLAVCSVVVGPIKLGSAGSYDAALISVALAQMILLVTMEELAFRAYSLSALVANVGIWKAQILTASAFAGCHVLFGWSIQSIALGVFPSGLLFGAIALYTRSVSAAIGLHLGMNFAQWTVRDTHGIFNLQIADNLQARVQFTASTINLALVLVWCVIFWVKTCRCRNKAAL